MSVFNVKAKPAGEQGEAAPAGNHPAVCVALIDLGTQETDYKGEKSTNRKVFLVWEIPGELRSDGKPFVLGRDYNLTLGKKAALRALIETWRGPALSDDEEFDITKLVGKPCLLSVVHKESVNSGNTYAKIDGVGQLPKGMAAPKPTRPTVLWSLEDDTPVPDLDWLPFVYGTPIKDVVAASEEVKGAGQPAGATAGSGGDDEIAF
jgi:hypothetical protein